MAQPLQATAAEAAAAEVTAAEATTADTGDAGRAGYRVVINPAGQRIRAIVGGETVADSTRVLVMHETRLKPAFYLALFSKAMHRDRLPLNQ